MRYVIIAFGVAAMLTGCQSARVAQPVILQVQGEADESGLAFWHALPAAGVVSNDDAFHALLLYFDSRDTAAGYEARVAALKQRGWLTDSFNEPADEAVKRGTIAAALVEAMDIQGGLMLRALGPSPRYATRELQYMNLYPLSSPRQTFTGVQLVELVSKVEDWQRRNQTLDTPQPPVPSDAPPPRTAQRPRPQPGSSLVAARTRYQLTSILVSLIASPTFLAQNQPAAEPAAPVPGAPADPNGLEITVTNVQGLVQVRAAEDQPWQPAQAGQKLTAGAEFRTGPRSVVQFTVGPTQTITLDRLGTVKVLDAIRRADGGVTTDVGMKYGRTTMQVQAAGVEHQSQIRSPGATLSVRGSIGALEDIGGTLRAAGLEGDVGWTDAKGQFRTLPPNSEHEGDKGSTADNRLADGTFNPNPFGTTPTEEYLSSYYASGTYQQDQNNFDVFRQQDVAGQMPMENGGGTLPPVGELSFIVTWMGFGIDIDSFVISPLGEGLAVFPSGGIPGFQGAVARTTPSGGAVDTDDTNSGSPTDPASVQGAEQLFWNTNPPSGTYTVGARGFSVSTPTTVNIDVFFQGQRLGERFTDVIQSSGGFIQTEVFVPGDEGTIEE